MIKCHDQSAWKMWVKIQKISGKHGVNIHFPAFCDMTCPEMSCSDSLTAKICKIRVHSKFEIIPGDCTYCTLYTTESPNFSMDRNVCTQQTVHWLFEWLNVSECIVSKFQKSNGFSNDFIIWNTKQNMDRNTTSDNDQTHDDKMYDDTWSHDVECNVYTGVMVQFMTVKTSIFVFQ